jgi:hypothetical protein
MKELNINRDTPQPSDEELLKHQNFDEILKKSGSNAVNFDSNSVSKNWWYLSIGSFVVLGVVVSTLVYIKNTKYETKSQYLFVNQEIESVSKLPEVNIDFLNNISSNNNQYDLPKKNSKTGLVIEPKKDLEKPIELIEYLYPKEASTLTFQLEASFGLKAQYQNFEEFSIYDNLAFQPIGDYQSGWLKASWSKVELVKKSGNYFLMLSKNGVSLPCQVIPVFESEDYVKALEVYTNATTKQ